MNLRKMIREQLEKEGYDGLYNIVDNCACSCEDLFPCDVPSINNCHCGFYTFGKNNIGAVKIFKRINK